MSHVSTKVTKKKKVRKSGPGRRLQKAKLQAKRGSGRRISKEPTESAKAEKRKVVEKKQKAMMHEAANAKMPEQQEKQADYVPGCEPEGRGAPPPLPTPIATFNF
jgi:hypothetical protein